MLPWGSYSQATIYYVQHTVTELSRLEEISRGYLLKAPTPRKSRQRRLVRALYGQGFSKILCSLTLLSSLFLCLATFMVFFFPSSSFFLYVVGIFHVSTITCCFLSLYSVPLRTAWVHLLCIFLLGSGRQKQDLSPETQFSQPLLVIWAYCRIMFILEKTPHYISASVTNTNSWTYLPFGWVI